MKHLAPAVLLLGLAASLPAQAFFWKKAEPVEAVAGLQHVGPIDPKVAALPAGFGSGVQIDTAMKMLLPEGWSIRVNSKVPENVEVKWSQGATWVEAITQITAQTLTRATADWTRKELRLDPLPRSEVATAPPPTQAGISPRVDPVPLPADLPVAAAPAKPAEKPARKAASKEGFVPAPEGPVYADLSDFLQEAVRVDQRGVSLSQGIQALLPLGWTVDVGDPDADLNATLLDLTHVGSRGAALNAIGIRENLTIIPFIEFRKLIVTRGGTE